MQPGRALDVSNTAECLRLICSIKRELLLSDSAKEALSKVLQSCQLHDSKPYQPFATLVWPPDCK